MIYLFLAIIFIIYTANADKDCPAVISNVNDRRINKNKLRLVQYNVEWLFIDYYSQMDCPGNGCTWKNQSQAETHMNYVQNIVRYLDPDIINFCEIEGCDELNIIKESLNTGYESYLIQGTDTATGQNVGMLTKIDPLSSLFRINDKYSYPIPDSNCGYTGKPGTEGVSKHYISYFNIGGYKTAIIGAHLLAIPTDPTRCSEREAQASVLQTIIASHISQGYEVIMLGDFNDFDNEVMDINNDKPISKVLEIIKGKNGTSNIYQLTNLAKYINQNKRYSDWYDSDDNCDTSSIKDFSMIDHILVSDGINQFVKNVFIYHGYSELCNKYNSDHFPVVVDFEF